MHHTRINCISLGVQVTSAKDIPAAICGYIIFRGHILVLEIVAATACVSGGSVSVTRGSKMMIVRE